MACIKLEDISKISIKDINLTVIYDNNPYREGLKTAWGFSCLVRGADKNILFDTGRNGTILMENIKELKISPSVIDIIVLSHVHDDHTGGLSSLLKENNRVICLKAFLKVLVVKLKNTVQRLLEQKSP